MARTRLVIFVCERCGNEREASYQRCVLANTPRFTCCGQLMRVSTLKSVRVSTHHALASQR